MKIPGDDNKAVKHILPAFSLEAASLGCALAVLAVVRGRPVRNLGDHTTAILTPLGRDVQRLRVLLDRLSPAGQRKIRKLISLRAQIEELGFLREVALRYLEAPLHKGLPDWSKESLGAWLDSLHQLIPADKNTKVFLDRLRLYEQMQSRQEWIAFLNAYKDESSWIIDSLRSDLFSKSNEIAINLNTLETHWVRTWRMLSEHGDALTMALPAIVKALLGAHPPLAVG